jgi:ankyrin repeat protein
VHLLPFRCEDGAIAEFLEAGADLRLINAKGETPLITFASKLTDKVPNRFHKWSDKVPNSRMLGIKLLVEAGADVNAVDTNKRTALHALSFCETRYPKDSGRVRDTAKILIGAGIAVYAKDCNGRTALDIFSENKEKETIRKCFGGQRSLFYYRKFFNFPTS